MFKSLRSVSVVEAFIEVGCRRGTYLRHLGKTFLIVDVNVLIELQRKLCTEAARRLLLSAIADTTESIYKRNAFKMLLGEWTMRKNYITVSK